MKPTITPEEFIQACNINRVLIECIFAQEKSFIEEVIRKQVRIPCDFSIDRVALTGHRVIIIIKFEDEIVERNIVIGLPDVYTWYVEEHNRLSGERK